MQPPSDLTEQSDRGSSSRHSDAEQSEAANAGDLPFLEDMYEIHNELKNLKRDYEHLESESQSLKWELDDLESRYRYLECSVESLEPDFQRLESRYQNLESSRKSHLDRRQRALSIWLRDAFGKDTEPGTLNEEEVPAGNVRCDAMVVTERYSEGSTERQSFRTLYGISPEDVKKLDQAKCWRSLQALNRAASILLETARTSLPAEAMEKKREDIVAQLLEGNYEDANQMSDTFLCDESFVDGDDF